MHMSVLSSFREKFKNYLQDNTKHNESSHRNFTVCMSFMPVVFCMTLVQFCFGLLNRISPAMNLFSLGFPISILMGLLCIYLTLPNLPDSYLHLTRELLNGIGVILREGGNV